MLILYEDQLGERKRFGFHLFICQCVLDRIPNFATSMYKAEKKIPGIPCKGDGNLRRRCTEELSKLANRYRLVFAVYDQDKLNKLLNLQGKQCRSDLRTRLTESCEPKEALEIVLIDKNLESVIETIRDSGHATMISPDTFERALSKKDLASRDSLFIQCANQTKETRDKLLEMLPDVNRLVCKIVETCRGVQ